MGLVYKVQHHSGVIFQFVAFIRKRKRTVPDILAAGGRYDHLVGFALTPHMRVCFFSLYFIQVHWKRCLAKLLSLIDPGVSHAGFHRSHPQRGGGQCCRGQSLRRHSQHGGASERRRHTLESDIANYYNEAHSFIFNDGFLQQSPATQLLLATR